MQRNKQAFTLIELLVVILIIGVLAAVAMSQYQKVVDKSRLSEVFSLAKNIKIQQEIYYLAHGEYADTCEELGADLPEGFVPHANPATQAYVWQKGNYALWLMCKNDKTRVRVAINDMQGFSPTGIEIFFDHIPDNVTGSAKGEPGKMFCSSSTERGMAACKAYGSTGRLDPMN
ncbi:MAG: prepilin-type N-terminal cleavage/methylation domain-containing protein [Elusimicrobiaceae bacterium]|nr:prepilin-type N-terminal cleavage/methylation domain-containing protein [Elusimicrobiaceae bacterium]